MFLRALIIVLSLTLMTSCANHHSKPTRPAESANGIGGTGKTIANGIGGTGKMAANGIGGTGKTNNKQLANGIGGTGKKPLTTANGIGGTGKRGTGVVGTITGFGSIWVKDAHIHFDRNTPVTRNQIPVTSDQLKLGHVVSVLNLPEDRQASKDSEYQAKFIDMVIEVAGPLTKQGNAKTLWILQQKVHLTDKTKIANLGGEAISRSQLPTFTDQSVWFEVSGYRKLDGSITATRIDIVKPRALMTVVGKPRIKANGLFLGDLRLIVDDVIQPASLESRHVWRGTLDNNALVVKEVDQDSIQQVLEEAHEIIMEGFIFDVAEDLIINDIEFVLPEAITIEADIEDSIPVFINADFIDEHFVIDDMFAVPEGMEEYEDLIPEWELPEYEFEDDHMREIFEEMEEDYIDEDLLEQVEEEFDFEEEFEFEDEFEDELELPDDD